MVKIFIDGKIFFVKSSYNLLQACLSKGFNVPFFCWHPALGSIGACRQCAVKVYQNKEDDVGSIVMSCMSVVQKNMRISLIDSDVKKFQKDIIELMMLNHPHDCPVCAEGGSCHLQDMTVLNKHHIRRYIFKKRIFKNQYLGPLISHNMNRCITCYRCIRYYKDYSGGKDFGVYGSNNKIYFGRLEDGFLESEYSGNLIDICPTGVFTDKTNINNFHRKWDLQYTPSICHNCSIGCNISIGERLGKVCRIDNRYNLSINKYFLCDLGRFGYNYINYNKVYQPFEKKNNIIKFLKYSKIISLIINIFRNSSNKILGIGSDRASIESNTLLCQLVGEKNFSNGMLPQLNQCISIITKILKSNEFIIPSISEIKNYDVILIISEDITQTASLAALAVRQAINGFHSFILKDTSIPSWNSNAIKNILQNKKNYLFIIQGDKSKLDDISNINYYGSIEEQLQFCLLLLDRINNSSNLFSYQNHKICKKIKFIAKILCQAKKPLIISGTSYNNLNILKISCNIARSLKKRGLPVGLMLFPPAANSIGISLIPSISLDSMFNIINSNKVDILIILENNLHKLYEATVINKIFEKVNKIIVLDHYNTKIVNKSDFFLPTTNFAESSGNILNYEGRLQRFFKVYNPNFYKKKIYKLEGWRWIYAILNNIKSFKLIQSISIDKIIKFCSKKNSYFKYLKNSSPSAKFRINNQKIARSSLRYSGRTAMFADINMHEPKSPIDVDSMFSFSIEGSQQTEKSFSFSPFLWSPNWNSQQSLYKLSIQSKNQFFLYNEGILIFKKYKEKHLSNFFIKKNILNKKISVNSFKIIPYYKLLGSEEISHNYFVNILKIKFFYAVLNRTDAKKMNIYNNDILQFQINDNIFKFPVKLSSYINSCHIGLPVGIGNIPMIFLNKIAIKLMKYNI
ncbi:NADH-quinone oxidoreductase subunit NuoG [Buchnera aphidicola]|uniref:NADH-quinone oxidoreductase subunit G n=1 Tax=Buchnera aphidicola subsp. Cinara cedri (strain Cc) TaxID=372461 RepID=Q057X0_BUCCC|nr:NADH-quinone oxidoreductase subunit NuoG [Buchnera aphidicola]ABJ90579.1 NADH dehydrogenase I chain G [Buchnera aphidicola BCc]